jgi:hypothetical protein
MKFIMKVSEIQYNHFLRQQESRVDILFTMYMRFPSILLIRRFYFIDKYYGYKRMAKYEN